MGRKSRLWLFRSLTATQLSPDEIADFARGSTVTRSPLMRRLAGLAFEAPRVLDRVPRGLETDQRGRLVFLTLLLLPLTVF